MMYCNLVLRTLSTQGRDISPTQYARFLYGRAPLRPYHPRRGAVWEQGDRRLSVLEKLRAEEE